MEDLRTGNYDYRENSKKLRGYDQYGNVIYTSRSSSGYGRGIQKEDEFPEQEFALYKVKNIIAVISVVLLILMDIFQIQVGGVGTQTIFAELSRSFTAQEIFQQIVQLPQHLFSSPAP